MIKLFSSLVLVLCLAGFCLGQSPSPSPTPSTMGTDKLGLNTETPLVPLHFTVHYPVNTTNSEEMIRFSVPNGHDPFQMYQRTTLFGNDQTNSVGWGFTPIGDVQAAPSLAVIMEDTFGGGNDPNENQFEFHYQMCSIDHGCGRPLTWNFNRKTGLTRAVQSTWSTEFYQGNNALHLNVDESLFVGPVRTQSDNIKFETVSNGGTHTKQIRIIPHPDDALLSMLTFGDSSHGIGVANQSGVLQFIKDGRGAAVNIGALQINGTTMLTTQCLAIPDPLATSGDLQRALIAILNCLRTQGIVATGEEVLP